MESNEDEMSCVLCVFPMKQSEKGFILWMYGLTVWFFIHEDKEMAHLKAVFFIKISNIFYSFTFLKKKQRCISVTELLTG